MSVETERDELAVLKAASSALSARFDAWVTREFPPGAGIKWISSSRGAIQFGVVIRALPCGDISRIRALNLHTRRVLDVKLDQNPERHPYYDQLRNPPAMQCPGPYEGDGNG